MERVAFIVEKTGQRIACLLNPEDVCSRRIAGVARRAGANGGLTALSRSDDALVATGGGVTEYDLRLLFDIEVASEGDSGGGGKDIRDYSQPFWNLAENAKADDGTSSAPLVRFVWGKSWNILGVVIEVAERLEYFDPDGAPRRSWLTLRLRRVSEPERKGGSSNSSQTPPKSASPAPSAGRSSSGAAASPARATVPGSASSHRRIDVPVDTAGVPLERLDLMAARLYGDPGQALALAAFNDVDDPLKLPAGTTLALPPLSALPWRGPA